MLGIDGHSGVEAEHPDCLLVLSPGGFDVGAVRIGGSAPELRATPNVLSQDHHDWPVIAEVADACEKTEAWPADGHEPAELPPLSAKPSAAVAADVIRYPTFDRKIPLWK